ncbi:MAG TPA: hypothetical protein PKW56_09735 [Clostridiales bacterium]|nr:hypothetical protein [Clostridiales bacterium]
MKKFTLIILALTFALSAEIKIFTNKTELYTGERLRITVEIDYPEGAVVDLSRIQNTQNEDFELVESVVKSQGNDAGLIKEVFQNDYAVFAKEGEHYFGPLEYSFVKGEDVFEFKSDSIRVNVKSIIKEAKVTVVDSLGNQKQMSLDSLGMVLPIKDIAVYKMSVREKWYAASFIALVVLLGLTVWLMARRKKRKNGAGEVVVEKKIPAHVIAFQMLDKLKEKNYLERGEFKEFAAELSLIFRNFLEDRFDFPGAELPTEELKAEIRSRVTDAETLEESDKLLEVTDFVKYAKFIPLEGELKSFLEFAYKAVDKLKEETNGKTK